MKTVDHGCHSSILSESMIESEDNHQMKNAFRGQDNKDDEEGIEEL